MVQLLIASFLISLLIAFCIVCLLGSHFYSHIKLNNLMKTAAEFAELLKRQSAALANLADDLRRLKEKLQAGGLTEAEEEKIYTDFEAGIVALETLAAATPEEETPPTEEEPVG